MNIKTIKRLFIGLLFLSCSRLFAQIHLGPGQAFNNLQAAVSSIKYGDTVFLHAGTYTGYQGAVGLKGNSKNPIVFIPYKTDVHEIRGCWQFQACEYLIFKNLNFKANSQSPGRLINVDNNGDCNTQSRFIIFDSCRFTDVTDAASITAFKFGGVDYFTIRNCVFDNIPNCDAFDFNVCHHGLIEKNRISNCLTGGHIKGGASDITMQQNMFLNASSNGWVAFEFGGDTGPQFYCPNDTFEVKDLRFYSNLIVGGARGFALSSARNCEVRNNTFYNCSGATLRLLNTSNLYPLLWNNIVEDNIFAFGTNAYMNASQQQSGSTVFNNNIYYSLTNPQFAGPYWDKPEMDSVKEQNPKIYHSNTSMFVDTAQKDLHLSSNSPAIGNGKNSSSPFYDFYYKRFSQPRAIGAIEYKNHVSVSSIQDVSNEIVVYPNPVSGNHLNLRNRNQSASFSEYRSRLYQITGEAIGDEFLHSLPFVLPIGQLAKGIYILRTAGQQSVSYNKFIIN